MTLKIIAGSLLGLFLIAAWLFTSLETQHHRDNARFKAEMEQMDATIKRGPKTLGVPPAEWGR